MNERGSSTFNVLIIIVFLLLFLSGVSGYLNQNGFLEYKIKKILIIQRDLENVCRSILEELSKDNTPSDSKPNDSFGGVIENYRSRGYQIGMEDVSSRLHYEYSNRDLFGALWEKEELFTSFRWNNSRLNPYSPDPFPYSQTLPIYNLYYMPHEILETLLSTPYKGEILVDWESKKNIILSEVDSYILSLSSLISILNEEEDRLVYYTDYLGVSTWFWKITAEKEGFRHVIITARLPQGEGGEDTLLNAPEWQIIKNYNEKIEP